jgi:hypothetical protein
MDASTQLNPIDFAEETLKGCIALMRRKNNDYAGTENFFKNLTQCETLGICSTEQGILVRLTDKLSRLSTLLGKTDTIQLVVDEAIDDTLRDVINYATLLITFRHFKNKPIVISPGMTHEV